MVVLLSDLFMWVLLAVNTLVITDMTMVLKNQSELFGLSAMIKGKGIQESLTM